LRRADPRYDLVLTDLRMPNCDGMELLRHAQQSHPDTPVVMITAHGTVDVAVEAMRAGAFDFITKPFEESELSAIVGKALARREANRARAYAIPGAGADEPSRPSPVGDNESDARAEAVLRDIIGVSPAMQQLFSLLRKVAPSPTTVLVRGESGTGKELVAQAIHKLSRRASGPFVAVNCTAIPENLFEAELFGHEKGAFTGAVASRPGRFELAHGGTLFLDEIGELPAPMQVKLLRVLQERIVERVGGLRPVAVDVRLVAATNADLETLVKSGEFREDLFYRLNVVPLRLPSLRERPSDIPALVDHFVRRFAERLGRPMRGIRPGAQRRLVDYAWPGNIRELENIVERMVLLADGDELGLEDLPAEIAGHGEPAGIQSALVNAASPPGLADARDGARDGTEADTLREETLPEGPLKEVVRERSQQIERDLILRALEKDDWNVTHAARRLGISRKGLQLKMRDYGLRGREEGAP
jgi:DNA-binding NtrC family response regulator